jgi:hypothetical protein
MVTGDDCEFAFRPPLYYIGDRGAPGRFLAHSSSGKQMVLVFSSETLAAEHLAGDAPEIVELPTIDDVRRFLQTVRRHKYGHVMVNMGCVIPVGRLFSQLSRPRR